MIRFLSLFLSLFFYSYLFFIDRDGTEVVLTYSNVDVKFTVLHIKNMYSHSAVQPSQWFENGHSCLYQWWSKKINNNNKNSIIEIELVGVYRWHYVQTLYIVWSKTFLWIFSKYERSLFWIRWKSHQDDRIRTMI